MEREGGTCEQTMVIRAKTELYVVICVVLLAYYCFMKHGIDIDTDSAYM